MRRDGWVFSLHAGDVQLLAIGYGDGDEEDADDDFVGGVVWSSVKGEAVGRGWVGVWWGGGRGVDWKEGEEREGVVGEEETGGERVVKQCGEMDSSIGWLGDEVGERTRSKLYMEREGLGMVLRLWRSDDDDHDHDHVLRGTSRLLLEREHTGGKECAAWLGGNTSMDISAFPREPLSDHTVPDTP